MNTCYSTATARLRLALCRSLYAFGLVVVPSLVSAADPEYVNYGTVSFPPQIDATNFINYGTLDFTANTTVQPFSTSDTLNFTNYGSMLGSVGWWLDDASPDLGTRGPAANFVNRNTGTIAAFDLPTFVLVGVPNIATVLPSYLWVTATNVVNRGLMAVGANGWMKLAGTNVDVSRSGLEVTPIAGTGTSEINSTNYFPDVAIDDVWWGTTNLTFDSSIIWDGTLATAPPHGTSSGTVSFSIFPYVADSYSNTVGGMNLTLTNMDGSTTNIFLATNVVKQAVFVSVGDPSTMTAAVRYYPSSNPTNLFQTVATEVVFYSTNVITQNLEPTTLFFYDTLASETNVGLAANVFNGLLTFRPVNYQISRVDDGRFAAGRTGTGVPDPAYLFDPLTYTNKIVAGEYAGYAAFVNNIVSTPPAVPGGTATNLPGRVQIYSDVLDMSSTRIRGEGEMIVQTKHLISSTNASVDCENLSYDLASTNGLLSVVNLAKKEVERLRGYDLAWSGLWSNQATIILPNYTVTNTMDTNGMITGTNATLTPLTNTVTVNLYALVLDGDFLVSQVPVVTWDLMTHSVNVVVNDTMTVVESLLIDGQSFTLNGGITLSSASISSIIGTTFTASLSDWIFTNAPNLLYFTNNGTLTIPSQAHFGDDGPIPYLDFVNAGTISAGSIELNSSYFRNNGTLTTTVGRLSATGGSGELSNGRSSSTGDSLFNCGNLKFANYQLNAGGALNLSVTNGLSDAGAVPGLTSLLRIDDGFNLLVKPVMGNLLGTAFQSQPPNFVEVDHYWAAADLGPNASGYTSGIDLSGYPSYTSATNQAIGKLVLNPQSIDPVHAPLFYFSGTGPQNGLYVDLLDLTALQTNYANMMLIDPSLTIYYAAAKLGFTPPPNSAGIPQEPEEFLDGQFGGHLRWVNTFAGPNSSVDVIINGVTVPVNRALRFSKIIDSNGNGIPNYYDPNPFNAVPLTVSAALKPASPSPASALAVSWNATPQTVYQVEFTADITHPNWQPLCQCTNTTATASMLTIWDTNAPTGMQRFYRVRTAQ
jgi:hypothetical protein